MGFLWYGSCRGKILHSSYPNDISKRNTFFKNAHLQFKYSSFSATCEFTFVNTYQIKNKDILSLIISEKIFMLF